MGGRAALHLDDRARDDQSGEHRGVGQRSAGRAALAVLPRREALECPSIQKSNGKFSYSTPENVAMAVPDPSGEQGRLPPQLDKVSQVSRTRWPDGILGTMSNSWLGNVALRRWLFLGYWLLMFIGTHVPRIEKIGSQFLFPHADKLAHFCMFVVWIVLSWWLLRVIRSRPGFKALAGLFVCGACYAAFDELTQSLVGRETSLADFAADLAGMLVAIPLLLKWRPRTQRQGT